MIVNFMKSQTMTRYRAFGWHLAISAAVGATLLALCWFVWYPAPMLTAIGGHEIFLLIVGIDVIVGPLLTLIVFKPGKRTLKFDLGVIAVMQGYAMFYGMSSLLEARPAYVASLGDAFHVVQASEVTDENLLKAHTTLPWWGPKWVGTKYEVDKDLQSVVSAVVSVGGGKGHIPQLHVAYESVQAQVAADAMTITDLKKWTSTKPTEVDEWLKKRGFDETTAKYQAIKISATNYAIILNAKTGAVVAISPFKLKM
jgi:hypothetical protein